MEESIIAKVCDGIIYEFVRNSKGTLIKKCCASCKHKQPYNSEGQRRLCCNGKKCREEGCVQLQRLQRLADKPRH